MLDHGTMAATVTTANGGALNVLQLKAVTSGRVENHHRGKYRAEMKGRNLVVWKK